MEKAVMERRRSEIAIDRLRRRRRRRGRVKQEMKRK
jgi:hypothetical protein